jgi:ATP-dependent Clp protease ATP-binding subunit ClpA
VDDDLTEAGDFTPRLRTILERSQRLAHARGQRTVGVEHVLLAILEDCESVAYRILNDHTSPSAVADALSQFMSSAGYQTGSTKKYAAS